MSKNLIEKCSKGENFVCKHTIRPTHLVCEQTLFRTAAGVIMWLEIWDIKVFAFCWKSLCDSSWDSSKGGPTLKTVSLGSFRIYFMFGSLRYALIYVWIMLNIYCHSHTIVFCIWLTFSSLCYEISGKLCSWFVVVHISKLHLERYNPYVVY